MAEKFTCPRRVEDGADGSTALRGGQNLDRWNKPSTGMRRYRSCSYCGSVDPDEFMRLVGEGVKIGPTDKSYKAYVGDYDGKFYFQHLSREQRREFIDRLNAGTVHIGYPGHFYVLPFFARPLPVTPDA